MTKDDDCGANVVLRIAVFVFRVGTGSLVIDSIYIYIYNLHKKYVPEDCERTNGTYRDLKTILFLERTKNDRRRTIGAL